MSAGTYVRSRYEADGGTIHNIRVQPETLALTIASTANTAPTGAVNGVVSARVSGGNRRIGLKARSVTLSWTATPPTGYAANEVVRVPVLRSAAYTAYVPGATGTYLGAAVVVVGRQAERLR